MAEWLCDDATEASTDRRCGTAKANGHDDADLSGCTHDETDGDASGIAIIRRARSGNGAYFDGQTPRYGAFRRTCAPAVRPSHDDAERIDRYDAEALNALVPARRRRDCGGALVSQRGEVMSYFSVGATELIARRSYSDMADWKDTAGKLWSGVTEAVNFYGDKVRAEGAVKAYEQAHAAQMAAAQKSVELPSWLLPAALGGAALLVITMRRDRG